jgi:hypothetical protein
MTPTIRLATPDDAPALDDVSAEAFFDILAVRPDRQGQGHRSGCSGGLAPKRAATTPKDHVGISGTSRLEQRLE